ncbi:MAG: hypothetical protein ACLFNR_00455 [Candidatus Paceibacterota bacterium]
MTETLNPPPSVEKKDKKDTDIVQILIYVFIGTLPFVLLLVLWFFIRMTEGNIELFLKVLLAILIVFLPLLFTAAAIKTYISYKKLSFFIDQGSILLEIKLPKNVHKPLVAMELLLEAFHQTGGEGTFIDRWIKGKTRPWFSLEMVSLEGQIHFFVWMRKAWRRNIEAIVYSQYPEAEVFEVQDYVEMIPFDLKKYNYWGCEYKFTKPDPYPIKTYIDYGLDKEKKEEYVVDPINSILEFLASVDRGEYIWIQILIRAHKKEKKKAGTFFGKTDWKEEGEKIVKKIIEENAPPKSPLNDEDPKGAPSLNLTAWQAEVIKSIQRNLDKRAFDVGIRSLYISEKEAFNATTIAALTGVFKQYNSEHMNSLAPTRGHTIFNYPWQDLKKIRNNRTSWELYKAYRWRSYFHLPYRSPHGVMSTEELATIFHIPGESSTTPTLPRVTSRKGDAPADLPG